jgi:hypothetical protein
MGGLMSLGLTERYKAACLLNPVIDIVTMAGTTDIPDWCWVESGSTYDHAALMHSMTPALFAAMRVRIVLTVDAAAMEHVGVTGCVSDSAC